MPIHDWTRVRANRFHHFHQQWTSALSNALNAGRLPAGYFAMIEQKTGGPVPDVITLEGNPPAEGPPAGVAVELPPPRTRFVARTDAALYAQKANRLTVRHPDGPVVAIIELVSPGNKNSRHALRAFVREAAALLMAGVHLLIVDLFPPSRRDPQGVHKAIWDDLSDAPFALPADKPLTVAAYEVGEEIVAYVDPVAVGDPLPDAPLFLAPGWHVPCPLEATYQSAWEAVPAVWREELARPAGG